MNIDAKPIKCDTLVLLFELEWLVKSWNDVVDDSVSLADLENERVALPWHEVPDLQEILLHPWIGPVQDYLLSTRRALHPSILRDCQYSILFRAVTL